MLQLKVQRFCEQIVVKIIAAVKNVLVSMVDNCLFVVCEGPQFHTLTYVCRFQTYSAHNQNSRWSRHYSTSQCYLLENIVCHH